MLIPYRRCSTFLLQNKILASGRVSLWRQDISLRITKKHYPVQQSAKSGNPVSNQDFGSLGHKLSLSWLSRNFKQICARDLQYIYLEMVLPRFLKKEYQLEEKLVIELSISTKGTILSGNQSEYSLIPAYQLSKVSDESIQLNRCFLDISIHLNHQGNHLCWRYPWPTHL